jgi:serine phosphatase RsbU (regulator of sigma subunit)
VKKILLFLFFTTPVLLLAQNSRKTDSLIKLLSTPQHDTVKFKILTKLVYSLKRININKAYEYSQQMLKMSEKMDKRHHADAYYYQGYLLLAQGKYDSAIIWCDKSIAIYKELNRLKDISQTYNQIANAYLEKPDLIKAVYYYQQSLLIKEKSGDEDGMSNTYANLGNVYNQMGNSLKAIEYFDKAAEMKKKLNDDYGYAACLSNKSAVLNRLEKYDEAINILQEAYTISNKIEDPALSSAILGNIGETYQFMKDLKNAEKYSLECLKIRLEIADSNDICYSYISLANIYADQGKYRKAAACALKAKAIAEKNNWMNSRYDSYHTLAKSYYQLGEYKYSADYFLLTKNVSDSLYNEQNSESINKMEAIYQTEKKDAELKLNSEKLKNQQLEIERQNVLKLVFGIALVLSLLVIFFVFRGYQQKKKANEIISEQKQQVEFQKKMIEEKNKEVTDSIFYARRIQRALLTSETYIKKYVPECFVLYKPKDIVSGDFYWSLCKNDLFMLMTADCTGHGVPGAFMSLMGINLLNEITAEKNITTPDLVLNNLRSELIKALNPEDAEEESKDGMDAVFYTINLKTLELQLACANNPIWIVRAGQLIETIPADKIPIGKSPKEEVPYTLHKYQLQKDDIIYSFTDGYADQFGGPKGKKFKYKQLQELLLNNAITNMDRQKTVLEKTIADWKGNIEQLDDILVIGIKV